MFDRTPYRDREGAACFQCFHPLPDGRGTVLKPPLATFGVPDLIIVYTPDATLVADKHDESALRQLLAELERRGWDRYL